MNNPELYHHGVKGMKWGVRRYQNKDGSLTEAGKKHRAKAVYKEIKKNSNSSFWDRDKAALSKLNGDPSYEKLKSDYKVAQDKFRKSIIEYDSALKQWEKEQPSGFTKELEVAKNKIIASAQKKFGDNLDDNDRAEWYMEDEITKARDNIGSKYSGYKKVIEARSRFEKAGDNVDTAVKNVANEILDRYADTRITVATYKNSKHKYSDTVSGILAGAMHTKLRELHYSGKLDEIDDD